MIVENYLQWKLLFFWYFLNQQILKNRSATFLNQIFTTNDIVLQYNNPEFVSRVQQQLAQFGYALTVNGIWDKATKQTIEAFQFHFRPTNYNGMMDAETLAILQALIQKYPQK